MLKFYTSFAFSLILLSVGSNATICLAESLSSINGTKDSQNEHSLFSAHDLWFGVYFKKTRVGYINTRLFMDKTQRESISSITEKQIHIEGGTTVTIVESLRFSANAPYQLLGGTFEKTRGTEKMSAHYILHNGQAELRRTSREDKRVKVIEPLAYTMHDFLALQTCINSSNIDCSQKNFISISMKDFTLTKHRALIDSTPSASLHPAKYSVRFQRNGKDLGNAYFLDENGHPTSMELGGDFRAVRENRQTAAKLSSLTRPSILSEVSVDRHIERPNDIRRLVFEFDGPLPELLPNSRRQRVSETASSKTQLEMMDFEEDLVEVSEVASDEFLKETFDYPVSNKRIIDIAKEVVGAAHAESVKVASLLRFVSEHLEDVDRANLNVLKSLKAGRGNCRDHARLFTTLARASGIPSREVAGLVYSGLGVFAAHSWNEVFMAGRWHAVDPTFNRYKLNPTYISFGTGSYGLQNLIRTMGKISLKVVEISYHEI